MTQFEKLDLLLRECGGTIQTFQVLNNGISKSVFYAYVKERGLEQASHGKGMARNKGISLKQKYRYFIGTICLYFRANIYYHISTKGDAI